MLRMFASGGNNLHSTGRRLGHAPRGEYPPVLHNHDHRECPWVLSRLLFERLLRFFCFFRIFGFLPLPSLFRLFRFLCFLASLRLFDLFGFLPIFRFLCLVCFFGFLDLFNLFDLLGFFFGFLRFQWFFAEFCKLLFSFLLPLSIFRFLFPYLLPELCKFHLLSIWLRLHG